MRCAEARKGKEMKAEERRWCAAAVCVLRHCFASSVFFGALAHHKWWRGRYRLLLLDLVRPLLVVRLNRLATGPNTSPPQASASILLCLVKRATEGRCVPLVLKVLCIRYWRQWLLSITRSRTGRRTVAAAAAFRFARQGKAAPDGASRAAAASKSRAAPEASRAPVDRTTALASAAALSKVLGWLLVVQ